MLAIKHIPLPYFVIDQEFRILDASDFALDIFGDSINFLDLVDIESQNKTKRSLKSGSLITTEIVMKTKKSPYSLYQIKIHWQNEAGHLICHEQDSRIQSLVEAVEHHRKRLSDTNFELLEKKEQLEESLSRITELSVPFIFLTEDIVLVPLFGELTKDLIHKNHDRILNSIANRYVERVLFDFHGIGEITTEGIAALRNLVLELTVMGTESYIIGVKPVHAQVINQVGMKTGTDYLKNLQEAIRTFIV